MNYNTVALVSGSGQVVERYSFDPFGAATVYDGNFNVRSGGSNYNWVYLFQGLRAPYFFFSSFFGRSASSSRTAA